jgi:hypothetical protein
MNFLSTLGQNVLGGVLASLVFSLCLWVRKRRKAWQFKQVFGDRPTAESINLVYEELELRDPHHSYPYKKPGTQPTNNGLSISRPVPIASVRAISYLASAIGQHIGAAPSVRSDREIRSFMDLDFISFGGPMSNDLTAACQNNNGAGGLAILDQTTNAFVTWPENVLFHQLDPQFDYGLILKIHPVQFPKRVWIACAGLNERGTSGAAWFLANKWQELRNRAGNKPFAALICVEKDLLTGRDQSAVIVEFRRRDL